MIEQIEVYKTNDGKLHKTKEEGVTHVMVQVENHIGKILDTCDVPIRGKLRVVEALAGDIDKVKALHNFLAQWVD